jgi:hypothetical protein
MDQILSVAAILIAAGVQDGSIEMLSIGIIVGYYQILNAGSGYIKKKKVVTKEVLLGLKDSAFYHYFINASDEQLILKYGFTRAVLNDLFEDIKPFYQKYNFWNGKNNAGLHLHKRKRQPRRQKFNHVVVILLALYFLKVNGDIGDISCYFGEPPTIISVNINYGLLLLELAMYKNKYGKISWPNQHELEFLCTVSASKYPDLAKYKIWGFIDGFKSACFRPTCEYKQNAYYSGYVGKHVFNNILLFDCLGRIRFCQLVMPGNCSDSRACSITNYDINTSYYNKVCEIFTNAGYNVLADSAFRLGNGTISTQDFLFENVANPSHFISMRQSAEWGMRICQSYKRIKNKLSADSRKSYLILRVTCHMVNYGAAKGMPNQIRSVFGESFYEHYMLPEDCRFTTWQHTI